MLRGRVLPNKAEWGPRTGLKSHPSRWIPESVLNPPPPIGNRKNTDHPFPFRHLRDRVRRSPGLYPHAFKLSFHVPSQSW